MATPKASALRLHHSGRGRAGGPHHRPGLDPALPAGRRRADGCRLMVNGETGRVSVIRLEAAELAVADD